MEWKEIEEMYKTAKIPDEVIPYLPKRKIEEIEPDKRRTVKIKPEIYNYYQKVWNKAIDYSDSMVRNMYKVKTSFYILRAYFSETVLDRAWEEITKGTFWKIS